MKETHWSLLFSVILLLGEKSTHKATLYQIALNSLTFVGLFFLYPLGQSATHQGEWALLAVSLQKKNQGCLVPLVVAQIMYL